MGQARNDALADINSSSSPTKIRSTNSPSHLLDVALNKASNKALPKWISDLHYAILSRIKGYFVFEPKLLVKWGFAKDEKCAYVYTKRLERLGVIVRSKRGSYRVVHNVVERLLQLPIRMISTDVRLRKGTRVSSPLGVLSLEGYLPKVASSKPSKLILLGPYLRPRYLGLFLDNIRGWSCGRYKQLPRELLLKPRDLDLFFSNKVSYFEVCHLVGNVLMDGCVVVYTNLEDLERFGASCRVEYRPLRDFVKDNGLFTLRKGVVELSKAFRALAIVLRSCLPVDELKSLFSWLSSLWSFALPSPPS
jgi:hypothetical protein